MARGTKATCEVTKQEKAKWKEDALSFLRECWQMQTAEAVKRQHELPKKLDRLSSFYLLHSTDWQYQVSGVGGYATFFEANTSAGLPIELRPLCIENMDRYSVNVTKAYYLLHKKQARFLPIWDWYHARHNIKLNSLKRSGMWPSIRLQMGVFEVFRGPFRGYAFWRQSVESMQSYLMLAEKDDPILHDEFFAICDARGLDPTTTSGEDLLESIREAKWLEVLAPKSCAGRWNSFEDSQRFW